MPDQCLISIHIRLCRFRIGKLPEFFFSHRLQRNDGIAAKYIDTGILRSSIMKKLVITSVLLMSFPVAGMSATDQAAVSPAGAHSDQTRPGSSLSVQEHASEKHVAAAAAHEQAATHHMAAAAAAYASQSEQAKENAVAAEKSSVAACEKSKEALTSTLGK
ncbi:hypothetical protein F6R98_13490 [Candidatus Methylospira mobilis]|uniref:Uncharacterized protein n=1 Tax=Candidatus Methylospira mobilis TaxID=1808979 RepID=A0A5Q0BN30_9GAMM|nr:hypothetical protein [Candidatus Methylospira mobilis]QFY43507.1 hypothetical protein F6R98_13490 [Candidatus Methylospira mobilis]